MELLVYLLIFIIAEIFPYSFIVAVDIFARKKGWKIITTKFSWIKSSLCEKKTISLVSLILLIFNICYLILALICAILDCFVYSHWFFVLFAMFGSIAYATISLCGLIILAIVYIVMALRKKL